MFFKNVRSYNYCFGHWYGFWQNMNSIFEHMKWIVLSDTLILLHICPLYDGLSRRYLKNITCEIMSKEIKESLNRIFLKIIMRLFMHLYYNNWISVFLYHRQTISYFKHTNLQKNIKSYTITYLNSNWTILIGWTRITAT